MQSVTFGVEHQGMERGVYLAKLDPLGGVTAVTLDLRLRRPYRDPSMTNEEMHTFEHAFATAVRTVAEDDPDVKVLYFGPMGCATGFYLVVSVPGEGDGADAAILRLPLLLERAVAYLLAMGEVPAKNAHQCGNFLTLGDISVAHRLGWELGRLLAEVKQNGYHRYLPLSDEARKECEEV